jgi:hypothetical protein
VNVSVLNFCSFVSACALLKAAETASSSVITQIAATSRKADLPALALNGISFRPQKPARIIYRARHGIRNDLGLELTLNL